MYVAWKKNLGPVKDLGEVWADVDLTVLFI